MKIIILMTSLFMLSFNVWGDESHTIESLNQKGFTVIMGELTGAGSKVSLTRLAGFIFQDQIIPKEKCKTIIVRQNKEGLVSDISRIEFNNQSIDSRQIEGIFLTTQN